MSSESFWTAIGAIATAFAALATFGTMVVSVGLWKSTRKAVEQTEKTIKENEESQRAIVLMTDAKSAYYGVQSEILQVVFKIENVGRSAATTIKVSWKLSARPPREGALEGEQHIFDIAPGKSRTVILNVNPRESGMIQGFPSLSVVIRYFTPGLNSGHVSRSWYEAPNSGHVDDLINHEVSAQI